MNAELKAKWIAALRSGKYKQARGVLRTIEISSEAFCCLGVYCEISETPRRDDGYLFAGHSLPHVATVPHKVVGGDCSFGAVQTLMDMNDSGKSFAEIADWIETNIPAEGDAA